IDAYIPDAYIKDGHQKIEMYKRFRGIVDLEDIEGLQEEMIDRFGEYPEEVSYLFQIAEMKIFAVQAGVELVKQVKQEVSVFLNPLASSSIEGSIISNINTQFGRTISLGMDGERLKMVLHIKGMETAQWLNRTFELIKDLVPTNKKQENPIK
ncbi:MAG: transcription-repair coupling factor, partial [Bacillota bacterium]|nr:transcription-repair coupling factor [Bacillota bacterium]